MLAARSYLTCVGVILLLALSEPAPAQQKGEGPEHHRPRTGPVARLLHLMPPAFAEELHLDPKQREKIQQLEQEFKQQRRVLLLQTARKVSAILDGLDRGDGEPAPVLAIIHEITGGLLEVRRTRVGFQKKVLAVLTEEQRERYEELRQRRPGEGAERRRARRAEGGARVPPGPWMLLAPEVQRQLHLSDEQRRKLDELRREWETRVHGVLTPEQQKRYDELTTRRRPRGGPREGKLVEPRGGKTGDQEPPKEPAKDSSRNAPPKKD